MGLFDKAFGKDSSAVSLNKTEGFAAIAVAAVASDGEISNEEVNRVVVDLVTLKPFRRHDMRDLGNNLNKVAGLIKKKGTGPVLQAAKTALNKDETTAAFWIAADLVLADGIVEDEEKKFLEELQKVLGVDDETALKIAEVAALKNKA